MLDATTGIQIETEIASRIINQEKTVAKLFFVNGMDKKSADFNSVITSLKREYGSAVIPLQFPIGSGS